MQKTHPYKKRGDEEMSENENPQRKLYTTINIKVKHNLDETIEKMRQLNELLKETEQVVDAIKKLNT